MTAASLNNKYDYFLSDIELIALITNRETANKGFGLLLNQYQERLYWHVRRIVLSHEDADDVLQNVFIKVFRYLPNFKGDSSLYTWLFRIATNEAIGLIKKRKPNINLPDDEIKEEVVAKLKSDPYFNGDDAMLHLKAAIASLPEKQMLVFNMKYFEGTKYNDMAEILETSVGALKASYHHAVKKIEMYIKEVQY